MDLSIVIISWNTANLLAKCLASIYAYPPTGNFEIFVVDNASSDDSVQMVRQQFPQVKLLPNAQNVGFARANNQAICQSTGKFLLLLNPDTEVKPGALHKLQQFMAAKPQAGAVGPQTLNPDGTQQLSCFPRPTLWREFWRLFHLDRLWPMGTYQMDRWPVDRPREVDALLGACLLLRKEALDQIGLLDESYFIYSEEIDLCYRLQQAGWHLYWLPQAEIIHYGGQSTQQVAADMFLQLYRGKLQYFRKHHGWLAGQLYKLILLTITLARLLVTPLAWFEQQPTREHHLTLANNYRRLLVTLPKM